MLRPYRELPPAVHLLCLGAFVNRAGTFVMPFLAIYLAKERHLGESFATLTLGVYGAGGLIASVVGGTLADRIGRRPVMLAALFGSSAWVLILSQLEHPLAILLGVLGFAMTADLYRPASSAMLADITTPASRPRAYSLLYVAINLGFAVGVSLGGQLAGHSFSWLFYGDAISSSLFALLILAAIPESKKREALSSDEPQPRSGWARVLSDRPFQIMIGANFLVGLVFHQAGSTLPLHMSAIGIPPNLYGAVMAINGVMIVVLQIPITTVVSRWRASRVLAFGAALVGAGFGLNAIVDGPGGYALTVAVWTIGEILIAALVQTAIAALAAPELRARYFGAFTSSFGLSMAAGPPLGGLILARVGGDTLWIICAIIGVFSAAMFLSVGTRIDGRETDRAAATA